MKRYFQRLLKIYRKGSNPPYKKIFIHIGTHKTGTTSIQSFLVKHAAEFSRSNMLIPKSGLRHHGHHFIAWELRGDKRLENKSGYVVKLLDELENNPCDNAIISSEDFEYLVRYEEKLKNFSNALRKVRYEPIFIVFFRDKGYLDSLRAELSKHGVTKPAQWYQSALVKNNGVLVNDDWWFDLDRVRFCSTWRKVTDSPLLELDYDSCVNDGGVVPEFLKAVGASSELIDRSRVWPRYNTRPEPEPKPDGVSSIKGVVKDLFNRANAGQR